MIQGSFLLIILQATYLCVLQTIVLLMWGQHPSKALCCRHKFCSKLKCFYSRMWRWIRLIWLTSDPWPVQPQPHELRTYFPSPAAAFPWGYPEQWPSTSCLFLLLSSNNSPPAVCPQHRSPGWDVSSRVPLPLCHFQTGLPVCWRACNGSSFVSRSPA